MLFEEELPDEGICVVRSYQSTRWNDGLSHLWIGRGEGSSELQFDSLEAKDCSQKVFSKFVLSYSVNIVSKVSFMRTISIFCLNLGIGPSSLTNRND